MLDFVFRAPLHLKISMVPSLRSILYRQHLLLQPSSSDEYTCVVPVEPFLIGQNYISNVLCKGCTVSDFWLSY